MPQSIKGLLMAWLWGVCLSGLFNAVSIAQEPVVANDPKLLTIERLFESGEFSEQGAPGLVWSQRSSHYFRNQDAAVGRDFVKVDPATGEAELLAVSADLVPAGQSRPISMESFELSEDESKLLIYTQSERVWRQNTRGDYWVYDFASHRLRQLGSGFDPSSLMFAKFSPDGSHVAYVYHNNLYVESVENGARVQLTDSGSDKIVNGTSDWVNEEELEIRDGFRWSPDSQSIAYWQFDTTGVPEFRMIDNTSEKYPTIRTFAYPKVGETNSATRVGIVPAVGGETTWLKIPGDPREHYVARLEWTPDGQHVSLQQFDRLQQNLRVMLADPGSGETRTVLTETDSAWVDNDNPFRWIDGGESFVWLSERSGWRRAYLASTDGESLRPLTTGDFDVIEIDGIDRENRIIYFAASPGDATRRYLYRVGLDGGEPERISPADQTGWHTYNISPNGKYANHSYSNFTNPAIHELIRLPEHEVIRTWTDNSELRAKLALLELPQAELLKVDLGNGVTCDAWSLKPANLDPTRRYPLFIYVYGEPYGQTVRDAWGGRQGLWHAMLAQQGYIVVSIDNRGTRVAKGRDWRKSIYRQIGILAPQDQAAALDALCKAWPCADPERVGIWGWSGGGSMTLNALFRYPEKYHLGIAVAPEPNQLLYDTIYQERYMGLPSDNAENYHNGSPLNHAQHLQGKLLLVHGTADDNCHYQGTELLINNLVAHGKQFYVMPYPGRSHSLGEGQNTTPHLYQMLTKFLEEGLPAGAR